MRTMRRIGVLVVAVSCLGAVMAAASEDKPGSAEGKAHASDGRGHAKGEHRININEASKSELMKLEGINAGVAQKIIAYREAHGPFKRAHDLEKVDGVGKEVLEKNAGRIAVK